VLGRVRRRDLYPHLTARINVEPPQIIYAPLQQQQRLQRHFRAVHSAAAAAHRGDVKLKNRCIPTAKNPEQPGSASKDGGGGRVTVFVCQQRGGVGGAHTQFARRVGVAHATQSAPLDIAQTHAADP
jgi:hypothetical protein